MPQSPPALVTPAVLQWARESLGLSLEEAARRVGVSAEKLERAERGDDHLTLRQAEAAARQYERPLAALFVPEPPEEEPPESQFRRLPGAPELPWPSEMYALSRRIRGRQAAAAELHELLEEVAPWLALDLDYSDDPGVLGARARAVLGIDLEEQGSWRDPSGYRALREWVDAVEGLGVLVMQDGSMSLDQMRGFASTHAAVPANVVNTNDDPRSRAFTIIHELGHLLRARAGREPVPRDEQWCNEFASAALTPSDAFQAAFGRTSGRLLRRIDAVALEFAITAHAAAVRVARLQLAPRQAIDDALEEIAARSAEAETEERRGGGNYYSTAVGRLGPSFVQLVLSAVDGRLLSYPAAAGLLGVKVNNFGKLRERAAGRAGER